VDGTQSVTWLVNLSDYAEWMHSRDIAAAVPRAAARSRNYAPTADSDFSKGTYLLA